MDERLIATIKDRFESRATDDLLAMWNEEDRDEWSDSAFEAIRRILSSRGHELSPKVPTPNIEKRVKTYPSGAHDNTYVCTQCHVALTWERPLPYTFLGFGKFVCPECGYANRYPLSRGYKIFYWLFVIGVVALLDTLRRQGSQFDPGGIVLFWFAAIFALVRNRYTKRRVQKAWSEHERKGKPHTDVPPVIDDVRPKRPDSIRWYHVLFTVVLPFVALPWWFVNRIRKQRPSANLGRHERKPLEIMGNMVGVLQIVALVGFAVVLIIGTARYRATSRANEENFKAVYVGMTEREVIRKMGEPESTISKPGSDSGKDLPPLNEGERDLWWRTRSQHALGVRIGPEGKVIYAVKEVWKRVRK